MAEPITLTQAVGFLTQAGLLATFLLVLVEFRRRGGRELAEIVLMFGSLAVTTVVAWIGLAGYRSPWLSLVSTIGILAHPYLMVRLVKQFRAVPLALEWALLALMVGGWGIMGGYVAAGVTPPTWVTLLIVAYFGLGELYAASGLISGAFRSDGVARKRLTFAAIGTGLLGAILLLVGVLIFLPALSPYSPLIIQPLGLVAIAAYYLGFAPPRWLRSSWQSAEVSEFLRHTTGRSVHERASTALRQLQHASMRLTGAPRATIIEPHPDGWRLMILREDATQDDLTIPRPRDGPLARAYDTKAVVLHRGEAPEAKFVRAKGVTLGDSSNVLVVPLLSDGDVRALVGVPLTRIPLFLDESVATLELLAAQAAVALDVQAFAAEQEELRVREARLAAEELRRQNLAMQEATRLKSEFLANMSHELRTPLNGIIGFAELMASGKVGKLDETHEEFMRDILTSARHLLQLINDVLDLAKVEAGRMEFRPERADPRTLVDETIVVVRPLSQPKMIALTAESARIGDVEVDPLRFKQVAYNFVSNAIKFTPEGGRVTVRIRDEGPDAFRLEVQDTGVGIKPDDIPKLFHEFQQLDAGMAKQHQGTGLGLALVKRLVEAQGGRVGVASKPGEGSTFHAVFPRRAKGVVVEGSAPVVAGTDASVLVVDDNERDRAGIASVLRAQGYAVDEAATATQAIKLVHAREYDAATLDLILPDGHGYEVLKAIRERAQGARVAVLIVTQLPPDKVHVVHSIEGVFQKPIDPKTLADALRKAGVGPSPGRPVLVVDDDATVRRLVETHLRTLGYRAIAAGNGKEALAAIAREAPALIVLDLVMPVMDGFEFLEEYRRTGGTAPVIVWTSKDLTGDEDARLRGQVQLVVYKADGGSFSLVNRLEEALTRR